MRLLSLFLLFYFFRHSQAQTKIITNEDIWAKGTFTSRQVANLRWMQNSDFYTNLSENKIQKVSTLTGQVVETLFDGRQHQVDIHDYLLVEKQAKILISSNFEPKYRYSGKADYYIFDTTTGNLQALRSIGKVSELSLSPSGNQIAYLRDNNIFINSTDGSREQAITTTGRINQEINGSPDWVYEEEFSTTRSYEWAPDGSMIAFLRFDESKVPVYHMQLWGKLYPENYSFKYPKAGENNSDVSVHIADVNSGTGTVRSLLSMSQAEGYLPKIEWLNAQNLLIHRLNRQQNEYTISSYLVAQNQSRIVWQEKNDKYVDFEHNSKKLMLPGSNQMIFTNETSGYRHLYLFNFATGSSQQLTSGSWEVLELLNVDTAKNMVYFMANKEHPLQQHLYALQYLPTPATASKSKKSKKAAAFSPVLSKLSPLPGTYKVDLSPDCKYYLESHTAHNSPLSVQLKSSSKPEPIKTLETNESLRQNIANYGLSPMELVEIPANGQTLYGFMLKPPAFDPGKKYPLLQFVYGGPGSKRVGNEWAARTDFYWHELMAQKGYVVLCVDGRGTGGRGQAFRQSTYGTMGKYETEDQIAVAQYMKTQPYIDGSRIGIWGWSYGGFMAANCILQGADVFKAAIAVAPVTDWRFYDTIYTERFNGLPDTNTSGYADYSPINHVAKLKGKFLLIHGTGDDNVHFQNTAMLQNELIRAGKQFDSFYYPNRNHGISGGNTRLHLFTLMTNWLLQNL